MRTINAVVLLFASIGFFAAASAEVGTYDVSQQDYSVPGKEPADVVAEDFVYRGWKKLDPVALWNSLTPEQKAQSPGGYGFPLSQNTLPILNYGGISSSLLLIRKSGQVPPHLHPRANSLLTFIKGDGPLVLEITDSSNKKFVIEMHLGDTAYIPQGLLHVMENKGSTEILALHQFNSAYPGTLRVIPALMQSDNDVLDTAFSGGLSSRDLNDARQAVVTGYPIGA